MHIYKYDDGIYCCYGNDYKGLSIVVYASTIIKVIKMALLELQK